MARCLDLSLALCPLVCQAGNLITTCGQSHRRLWRHPWLFWRSFSSQQARRFQSWRPGIPSRWLVLACRVHRRFLMRIAPFRHVSPFITRLNRHIPIPEQQCGARQPCCCPGTQRREEKAFHARQTPRKIMSAARASAMRWSPAAAAAGTSTPPGWLRSSQPIA